MIKIYVNNHINKLSRKWFGAKLFTYNNDNIINNDNYCSLDSWKSRKK